MSWLIGHYSSGPLCCVPGSYVLIPNTVTRLFQAITLGPILSISGRHKMGMLKGHPFDHADVAELTKLIEAGEIKAVIDRRYALDEAPEALRYQDEGLPAGKLVVNVEPA